MTPLIPAIGAAMVVAGLIGLVVGLWPSPAPAPGPSRRRLPAVSRTMVTLASVGIVLGVAGAALSGWLLALVVVPAAVVGLPVLLKAPRDVRRIDRLEGLEEWTRSLAGVFTAGAGLEQALVATAGSAPGPIRTEVLRLVSRLRARWTTEQALRAFADDLDDVVGDQVVAQLILASRRRGARLADGLEAVASSVAAEVRARRQVEADRAKPRTTARWVTLITVGVLVVLGFTGTYIAPYRTPLGQLLLGSLLACYVGLLVWMRRMSAGPQPLRLLGERARREAER